MLKYLCITNKRRVSNKRVAMLFANKIMIDNGFGIITMKPISME